MKVANVVGSLLALCLLSTAVQAQQKAAGVHLRGVVVDEAAKPVAGALVGYFIERGPDENGMPTWRAGEGEKRSTSDANGKFDCVLSPKTPLVCGVDSKTGMAGYVMLAGATSGAPLTIVIHRLGEVDATGTLKGLGCGTGLRFLPSVGEHGTLFPFWSQVGQKLLLPPGEYTVHVGSPEAKYVASETHSVTVKVSENCAPISLGEFAFTPNLMRSLYGKTPPGWAASDARGVPASVQPSDFKGKWLIVDFWAYKCHPCCSESLPGLIKFYNEHQAQKDRFQIVAVHIDYPKGFGLDAGRQFTTLDPEMRTLEKAYWGGKALPFPILLDATGAITKGWAIGPIPHQVLIDPNGNVVKDAVGLIGGGDCLTQLAEGLASESESAACLVQASPKDVLKEIEDFRNDFYIRWNKDRKLDFQELRDKISEIATNALKGIDPTKIDPKDAYDYALIYNVLGDHKIVCDLTHKFVAANPSPSEKFDAQMLMMESCNALGEGDMLDETVNQAEPITNTQANNLAWVAGPFVTTIAQTQGDKEALKALDRIEKETVLDPHELAKENLKKYRQDEAIDHSNDPNYKAPSDDEAMKFLIARYEKSDATLQWQFVYTRAQLLTHEGNRGQAIELVDKYGATHPDYASKATAAHNFLNLYAGVPPELKFEREYGNFKSLADWKGKVVVIDTFAHWCGPCKASLPSVRKMYDDLHERGLEIVGVTAFYGFFNEEKGLDKAAEYERMDGFMNLHNMDWPVIFDDKTNFKNYGISAIPTAVLIGRDGKVITTETGFTPLHFSAFRAQVEKALDSK